MKIIRDLIQGEPDWHNIRKAKITWTSLKWVTWGFKAQQTAMYELLAEEYILEEDLNAWEAMERWNMLEWHAKSLFDDITWLVVE